MKTLWALKSLTPIITENRHYTSIITSAFLCYLILLSYIPPYPGMWKNNMLEAPIKRYCADNFTLLLGHIHSGYVYNVHRCMHLTIWNNGELNFIKYIMHTFAAMPNVSLSVFGTEHVKTVCMPGFSFGENLCIQNGLLYICPWLENLFCVNMV